MKKSDGITCAALALKIGCDRGTIERHLRKSGIKPIGQRRILGVMRPVYDEKELTELVRPHMRGPMPQSGDKNIDPVSGLTWGQLETKEKALTLRRENEIADKVKLQEWMSVDVHHRSIAALVGRIEQVPGKAKSQLGLSDSQVISLRKMLDECRAEAAAEVEADDLDS